MNGARVITAREMWLNELADWEGKPVPFPTGSDLLVVDATIVTNADVSGAAPPDCTWQAFPGGREECGPYGFGRTADEARRDLIDNYDLPGAAA